MWLGYDPPDFADAMFERAARHGTEPLRRFQAGLVAAHSGEIGQLTLIGHSGYFRPDNPALDSLAEIVVGAH